MLWSPTRKMMKVKPIVAHTSIITSPGSAQVLRAQPVGRVETDVLQVVVERPGFPVQYVGPHQGHDPGRHEERRHDGRTGPVPHDA